jgi:thiamine pyrophosphokinase
MTPPDIVSYFEPVTLLGGGSAEIEDLRLALALAPVLIAADGGANMACSEGLIPDLVIGDFDSITPETLAAIPASRQRHISEQDSTDFEKCLSRIEAPFILGVGFTGARIDHQLAVCNALVRYPARRCVLISAEDVIFAAPSSLALPLAAGTRVSLFPMASLRGESRGLRWPIGGIDFAPSGRGGTSNEALGTVDLSFANPGMLVILPRDCLQVAIAALAQAGS